MPNKYTKRIPGGNMDIDKFLKALSVILSEKYGAEVTVRKETMYGQSRLCRVQAADNRN